MIFMEKNFILKESLNRYDCWTRYYVPKNASDSNTVQDPSKTIVLSNMNDDYWIGSSRYSRLLVDYSDQNMEKLKNATRINVSNAKKYRVIKVDKMGDFIHINLDRSPLPDKESLKFPTSIGFN